MSEICFAESTQMAGGAGSGHYVFNAATNLLQPRHSAESEPSDGNPSLSTPCHVQLQVRDEKASGGSIGVSISVKGAYETPPDDIKAAFLARTSKSGKLSHGDVPGATIAKPNGKAAGQKRNAGANGAAAHTASPADDSKQGAAAGSKVPDNASEALRAYATDLAPYYLSQYELQGMAVTAYHMPKDHPLAAQPNAPSASLTMVEGLAKLAIPLMRRARPHLADVPDDEIRIEMRPMPQVLRNAADARRSRKSIDGSAGAAAGTTLEALMYDDAFVHSLTVRLVFFALLLLV